MRKEIEEIDLNEPSHEKNEQVCVIQHPAILIIGEAGAGKSTFGNWLLGYHGDNGPFEIGGSNDHVTNICKSRLIKIIKIKNRTYNLIDTPGLFDPNEDVKSDESLNKIADAINHCSYGIQAIVLVIKKDRPFDSQTIKKIKSFLGEPALNHMIVALTYCNLKQTGNKEKLLESLSPKLKSFLDSIGYRYIISPNPDLFPKGHKIVNNNMENAKEFINNFPEAYTTETFNKVRQAREECEKIALLEQENKISQEEIKKLKEQIDEIGRRIAKEEAAKKCFKLDTKVILEGGNLVPMSGITVNDKICVDVINGKLKFSEVYLIAHCDYEDETEFLKVEYISPSTDLTESVTLTPDHHIITNNYFDFAKSIKPHITQLRVLDGTQMKFVRVTNVTTETNRGYIAIFTRAGTIVADNVMCSCYATVPPSYQSIINLLLMPLMISTKLKKSEYDGKTVHPYLDFLYSQYKNVNWMVEKITGKNIG